MVDFTIPDLTAIGGPLADNTVFEVHRNGQSASEKAAGSDLKSFFGTLIHPGYVPGRWYVPDNLNTGTGGTTAGANVIRLTPWIVPQRITVSSLMVRVIGVEAAKNFQMAIYRSDVATKLPTGNAVGSTASASVGISGNVAAALTANVQVEAGELTWVGLITDSATATFAQVQSQAGLAAKFVGTPTLGKLIGSSAGLYGGLAVSGQTLGVWPNLTSASFSEEIGAVVPTFGFLVASVP